MTQSQRQPLMLRDAQVMRALAHPARIAIMEHLRGAEATATECAEVCGLSPSATSYHLRTLAKFGLVEPAPGRGDGRERVWRAVAPGFVIDTDGTESPEEMAAAAALFQVVLDRDDRRAREWVEHADRTEPKEWTDAAGYLRLGARMTADELADLYRAVRALFDRYSSPGRPDPPPGSRPVTLRFQAFPDD